MFITTDDTLASDTFNSDGTLKAMASYLHIALTHNKDLYELIWSYKVTFHELFGDKV